MKLFLSILLLVMAVCYSCRQPAKKPAVKRAAIKKQAIPDTSGKNLKPVFGYRFTITGDFNGDGKREKLTEHYVSKLTHQETNKFYLGATDYVQLIDSAEKKHPSLFITCDDNQISTLAITDEKNQFGLFYLKNEGDLDGDGGDEVSYVIDWCDWSNLNTWKIATYKNGKWKDLYSFGIWEWQLPDIPQTYNQYGIAGRENKIINTDNIEANKKIQKELDDFGGLVKKVAKNKIQIMYRNDSDRDNGPSLDTVIVKLTGNHTHHKD